MADTPARDRLDEPPEERIWTHVYNGNEACGEDVLALVEVARAGRAHVERARRIWPNERQLSKENRALIAALAKLETGEGP